MKIKITKQEVEIEVDEENAVSIQQIKWRKAGSNYIADFYKNGLRSTNTLGRFIMGVTDTRLVRQKIVGNDWTKGNLVIVDRQQFGRDTRLKSR